MRKGPARNGRWCCPSRLPSIPERSSQLGRETKCFTQLSNEKAELEKEVQQGISAYEQLSSEMAGRLRPARRCGCAAMPRRSACGGVTETPRHNVSQVFF